MRSISRSEVKLLYSNARNETFRFSASPARHRRRNTKTFPSFPCRFALVRFARGSVCRRAEGDESRSTGFRARVGFANASERRVITQRGSLSYVLKIHTAYVTKKATKFLFLFGSRCAKSSQRARARRSRKARCPITRFGMLSSRT